MRGGVRPLMGLKIEVSESRFGAARPARVVGSMIAIALAAGAIAQAPSSPSTVPDQQVPTTGLNIPENLQIFGKVDPNVRKPTAIVNDAVITGTDVDQRLAMIVAINQIQLPPEDRERLRLQILRQLIDETLQIQQAKTAEIEVTAPEIDQSVARIAASSFKLTPAQFVKFLRDHGSSERSIRRQVEGELAWQRFLRRRVEPFVNVGDEEVKAILDRLRESRGTEEYHLNEIYLSATPDRAAQVAANAQQIIQEIQKGQAPFAYFARNYSEASTRGVGGDLDWVRLATLPPELAAAARDMQVGQVAGPVPLAGGFSILYLQDKRQVLMADARDARLNLKQVTMKFHAGIGKAEIDTRTAAFAKMIQSFQGCGSVEKIAAAQGAEVVGNDTVRIRDLPGPLQAIMIKLSVGEATPPFGSQADGVRALVLCGRDDPQSGDLPAAAQVQSQLEQQRVNLRAQQKLRDLRRDAVIEYR